MKQSTKKIINVLCYIGIFILILIISLPPLLRFLLPDKDEYTNPIKLELLTCTKTEEETKTKKIIKTHYKNNKVELVDIIYTNVVENSYIDEKDYYNLSGVEVDDQENIITINITPNNYNKNRLNTILRPLKEQKSIYEDGDYNYICNVTENK